MQILWSHTKTTIKLEEFCYDLNEKLITAASTLDDSVSEINLSTNQEVGYLASELFQLKLAIVPKGIFQQLGTISHH